MLGFGATYIRDLTVIIADKWFLIPNSFQSNKSDIRKVPVPANRYTPLKENWMKIFTPIVEHLHLQMRFNLKTRNVEIKVSCEISFLRRDFRVKCANHCNWWHCIVESHLSSTCIATYYIYGLVQDCSNSIAKALELLQSCTNPSIWWQQ